MNRIYFSSLILLLIGSALFAPIGNRLWAASNAPVAVMPLESADKELGEEIAARLLTDLQRTRQFTLIERNQLQRVLEEIAHSQSGLVSDETVIEVGQQLGAEYMVVGEARREGNDVLASVRIIKTATGVVIGAEQSRGSFYAMLNRLSTRTTELLRIYLLMNNPDSPYTILLELNKGENPRYRMGEKLSLQFKVLKHQDTAPDTVYIQLFSINAVGAMTLIYPNKYSPRMEIQVGQEYSLPGPGDDFEWQLVPPDGVESIQAIVTTRPVDFFDLQQSYKQEAFPTVRSRDNYATYEGIQVIISEEKLEDWSADRVTYFLDKE